MSACDVLYRFREWLFARLGFIAFRIHCKHLLNEPFARWMLHSLSHAHCPKAAGSSCFAAHNARRISFPDVDSCVAAIWTPPAECLLQHGMGDHSFIFAQGLTQNQIAFRPMVMTGRGTHENVTGGPLPYSFQCQQTIFYFCVSRHCSPCSTKNAARVF